MQVALFGTWTFRVRRKWLLLDSLGPSSSRALYLHLIVAFGLEGKEAKKTRAFLSESKTAVSFSLSIPVLLPRYSQRPYPEHLDAPSSVPEKRCECPRD